MSAVPPRVFSWQTLPWFLLALSLTLNVFFVGGHVYTRALLDRVSEAKSERARFAAERLGLDPAQQQEFKALRRKIRARRRDYRVRNREHLRVLWSEIAKPTPDETAVDARLRALADNRYAFHKDTAAFARDFLANLGPDQKKAFLDISQRRNPLGGGRPWRRAIEGR